MVVVLAQQNRNAGTYRTPTQAATKVPNGVIRVTAILGAADLQDATLSVTMGMEANPTANASANDPNWFVKFQSDWHGGAQGRDGSFPPPTAEIPSDDTEPSIRGFMTINKRVSIGIDAVVITST